MITYISPTNLSAVQDTLTIENFTRYRYTSLSKYTIENKIYHLETHTKPPIQLY